VARFEIARDGDEARVLPGDEVVVRLPENSGTGYRWDITKLPAGVEVVFSELHRTGGDAPGAGGQRVITLRATQPVDGPVRFTLARSWETEQAPLAEFTFSLRQRRTFE
jgi:predicted secreted protein